MIQETERGAVEEMAPLPLRLALTLHPARRGCQDPFPLPFPFQKRSFCQSAFPLDRASSKARSRSSGLSADKNSTFPRSRSVRLPVHLPSTRLIFHVEVARSVPSSHREHDSHSVSVGKVWPQEPAEMTCDPLGEFSSLCSGFFIAFHRSNSSLARHSRQPASTSWRKYSRVW